MKRCYVKCMAVDVNLYLIFTYVFICCLFICFVVVYLFQMFCISYYGNVLTTVFLFVHLMSVYNNRLLYCFIG